jgi:hypothetical protein
MCKKIIDLIEAWKGIRYKYCIIELKNIMLSTIGICRRTSHTKNILEEKIGYTKNKGL